MVHISNSKKYESKKLTENLKTFNTSETLYVKIVS